MKLVSVNVGQPKATRVDGRAYRTGIDKRAVVGRVQLGQYNLAGDGQADLDNHGGLNRAVYCYPQEHYAYWSKVLDRDDFEYGQFGENLTLQGLLESEVCIGDIYEIGQAVIQPTQPRVPCYKLEGKLGIHGFAKTFLRSNRSGFYARVLEEGAVAAGDGIRLLQRDGVGMTVAEVNAALYLEEPDRAAAERALRLGALSPEWRRAFEKRISA